MFVTLAFCKGVIAYILWKNMSGSVAETAVSMAFISIISIVGSYVFGAAWQDINTTKTLGVVAGGGQAKTASTPKAVLEDN